MKENMTHAIYPSLAGKTVVITGGGSGIGEVIVREFRARRSRRCFSSTSPRPNPGAGRELGEAAQFIKCDLKDLVAFKPRFADIEAKAGPVACWSTTPRTTIGTRSRR